MRRARAKGRGRLRSRTLAGTLVVAVAVLGTVAIVSRGETPRVSTSARTSASAPAPVEHRALTLPPAAVNAIQVVRERMPPSDAVPEFRSDARMTDVQRLRVHEYETFVKEAGLTEDQDRQLRRAIQTATLTFEIGLHYVAGEASGVTVDQILEAAYSDLQPALDTLSDMQRERFGYFFHQGSGLVTSRLFDVRAAVDEALPQRFNPDTRPN